jgi:hypothetical protein
MFPTMVGFSAWGKAADLTVPVDVVKLKDVESLFSSAVGTCLVTLLLAPSI